MIMLLSCSDEIIRLEPTDDTPPGKVSDVTWKSIPGGAVFRYKLPDDQDLLKIKAVFSRRENIQSEVTASIYSDSLKIEGFGNTEPRKIELIAIDRSNNESEPVEVTITPDTPDIIHVEKSLGLKADFGGIQAFWDNPNEQTLSVVMLVKDHNSEYVPFETFYSSMPIGKGLRTGMDTIPVDCAIFAKDRWGNSTEIKYFDGLVPIFETLFDRLKFKALALPTDGPNWSGGWPLENAFDGIKGNNSGYSSQPGTGSFPQWVTIDMGVVGKISRLRVYQRVDGYTFAEGNLKEFEIYGATELDITGAWSDKWELLMQCESIKPSGLPIGQNTAEDEALARAGEDFYNSPENPAVRYIRIKVLKTWAGGDNFQINEIEIYGDNRASVSTETDANK